MQSLLHHNSVFTVYAHDGFLASDFGAVRALSARLKLTRSPTSAEKPLPSDLHFSIMAFWLRAHIPNSSMGCVLASMAHRSSLMPSLVESTYSLTSSCHHLESSSLSEKVGSLRSLNGINRTFPSVTRMVPAKLTPLCVVPWDANAVDIFSIKIHRELFQLESKLGSLVRHLLPVILLVLD